MNMLVSTAATAAALPVDSPSIAAGPPDIDPIFAAIEKHRVAMDALKRANAEQERVLRLADEMVGRHELSVLDMREPSNPPRLASIC
ncbi:hypothetical protein ABH977_006508 [Bradyrhizobium ottawaense]|uniref:hypothetical protein n=1 Tax=Bradyrhizobium ottawaense TaxID=931866 RepID=UPI003514A080